MNDVPTIDQVQAAIARALRQVPELRAAATEPDQPNFPLAYPRLVDWTYDISFAESMDCTDGTRTLYHFDLWVLVSLSPNLNRAQTMLNPYLSPTGTRSVKQALEDDPSLDGVVDFVRITSGGAYGRSEIGGIACLAASVRLEVYA